MRGTSLVATVVAIGASVLAVGCGQLASTGSGPVSAPKAQARCVTPKLASPGGTLTITDKDNGKSFCIVTGTGVYVFLHGTPTHMWAHLHPSSAALQPRASGRMTLMRGVTGGYFVAMRFGDATLTSARTPCHASAGSATHCTAQSFFRVTLVIRGKA
jgi:hypothetical protein